MSTLETWTMVLHVGAGTVALLAGLGAMVTTKGGLRHRRAGKAFVGSMGVVVATTVLLLGFVPSTFRIFLALVAVFSGYLAFSGYRVLSRKRPADEPAAIDWVAAGIVVLACLALGVWGAARLVGGSPFGAVLLVFGGIGLAFGTSDLRSFRAPGQRGEWTVTHLQRMVGAFIATVSAVSAINLTTFGIAAWLWPTAALTPLVVYWSRKYGTT